MIRLILRIVEDCGGIPVLRHKTLDVNVPKLEYALSVGGFDVDRFHAARLIGAEDTKPGARFIIETAHSQDGYVLVGHKTIDEDVLLDLAGLSIGRLSDWGTVIGAEVKP